LTDAANEIRATDLAARLPAEFGVRDELTDLAETFNSMIERLEASFIRERRFSANAAHELMTPLTNMRNWVDVTLRRERTSERYRSTLETMLLDIEQMSETVRGLLQISQAELLADLPTEPVDMNQLARECADRFRERARSKNIDIQLAVESGMFVDGDSARLSEVVENLVDNSLKYTPNGGEIVIEIEGDLEEVRVRVSDNGMGFSKEQAEQLFDRFYRADTSEVQALEGSGLGLTIVQTIAHAYGGTVSAFSSGRGAGSTFELQFPRVYPAT
jgi:signal transduction histidine kinase